MLNRNILAALVLLLATPVMAAEQETTNINGTWTGTGYVQKDENSRKINVKCEIEGEQDGADISFEGACRAMLIMKRAIGAKLKQVGEGFVGTYKGADAGIAELDGGRPTPDKMVLQMRFPREVNGDDVAEMIIDHPEVDAFTITTTDVMSSGVEIVTSSIRFEREGSLAAK